MVFLVCAIILEKKGESLLTGNGDNDEATVFDDDMRIVNQRKQ